MKYQKPYSQIQREKSVKRLKFHLLFVAGILVFLIVLGLVGRVIIKNNESERKSVQQLEA